MFGCLLLNHLPCGYQVNITNNNK